MNANKLRSHYKDLAAGERFPAMIAAAARGDDNELDALLASAPRKSFSVPNTYGLAQAWKALAVQHALIQAELFGMVYFIMFAFEDSERPELDDMIKAYVVNDAAFRQVCRERALDPDAILQGYEIEQHMSAFILGAWALHTGSQDPPADEVSAAAEIYRQCIDSRAGEWG